jgi:hypothetical protein
LGQETTCPQLSVVEPQAVFAQVVVRGFGVQQVLPMQRSVGDEQLAVPALPQGTDCPQLFVAVPHVLPLQALVLSGVQQVWSDMQTPALGQVAGQDVVCPQLLVTLVLHLPAQAAAMSGVQQVLPTHTSLEDEQLTVPPLPQGTDCPQLLVAVPQVLPLQVVASVSGTQPQDPPSQVSPPSQAPHEIVPPQLSVVGPQRFRHHTESGVGEQQLPLPKQAPPSGQAAGQLVDSPQLLVAVVLHLPAHVAALSGVQQVPSALHTSPLEAHPTFALGPQGTF